MVTWYRPTLLPIDPAGTPDRGYATMRVTSPWGNRDNPLNPGTTSFHNGLDIGNARLGDVVTAVAAGEVVATGYLRLPWSQPSTAWASGNFGGLMVVIAHGTHVSGYAHLRRALVGPGQRIAAGQPIGEVGESGSAQGRGHLHFYVSNHSAAEIIKAGRLLPNAWTVDPWPLIEPAAGAGDLPDTALEDPMPKIIERITGQVALIERVGIPLHRSADSNSGSVYSKTTKATSVQPFAVVEGGAYGVGDGKTSNRYIAYVGTSGGAFFPAYVAEIYTRLKPIATSSGITQADLDAAAAAARDLALDQASAAVQAIK
jgi:hypothetical protein